MTRAMLPDRRMDGGSQQGRQPAPDRISGREELVRTTEVLSRQCNTDRVATPASLLRGSRPRRDRATAEKDKEGPAWVGGRGSGKGAARPGFQKLPQEKSIPHHHIKVKGEVEAAPVAFTLGELGPQKQGGTVNIPTVPQPLMVLKMRDLKAPGKQPLPCFLTSSTPRDRPRPVPNPARRVCLGLGPASHSCTGLSVSCAATGCRERLSPGLPPPHPAPDWRQQSLFPQAGFAGTWPRADQRCDLLHFNCARAHVQERKSRLGFTLAVSSCRGHVSKGWIFPGCDLVSSPPLPEPHPLRTNRTPPGVRAHHGPWGYILMLFLPGPRRLGP